MTYTYILKSGKEIMVERYYGDCGVLNVIDKGLGKRVLRNIRTDESCNKFFTWDRQRVYLDKFQAMTPQEIVSKVQDKESNLKSSDLCCALIKNGIDSLRVIMKQQPLVTIDIGGCKQKFAVRSNMCNENEKEVIYKFTDKNGEYLPETGYKLKLVPADPEDYNIYPKETHYVDDLMGIIARGKYKLVCN